MRTSRVDRAGSVMYVLVNRYRPDFAVSAPAVVLAAAPWVRMRLIRVLNNFGVGSLNSLLIALIALMQAKQPTDPLVINLSLGMLPAFEQLPDVWFGFPIEGLPRCPPNPDLQFLPDGKPLTRAQMLSQLKDDSSPVSDACRDANVSSSRTMRP